ncbi:ferritin-like domain-containing protein [Rhodococcus opacus]|nr:ferritin-like domain-containing protein [Rhodococcus opacus]
MPSVDTSKLIIQLRALLHLTRTEIQIAETRQAQARTDVARREFADNAERGRKRCAAIDSTLRDLGGVPDVVAPLVGRLSGWVTTVAEQAGPLDEALLCDLGLEHQLFDRARYLKVLATAAGNTEVRELAERLGAAHQATAEWLSTILAEEALGGPAALRRTPLQAVAGGAGRLVYTPAIWSSDGVDRVVDSLKRAREWVGSLGETGTHAKEVATDVATESLSAGLERAEEVALRDGATSTAAAVHRIRKSTGALSADELPIDDFDHLNGHDAAAAVKTLTAPDDIRAIIAYEEHHRNRHGVVAATQTQLATLAKEAAGIN